MSCVILKEMKGVDMHLARILFFHHTLITNSDGTYLVGRRQYVPPVVLVSAGLFLLPVLVIFKTGVAAGALVFIVMVVYGCLLFILSVDGNSCMTIPTRWNSNLSGEETRAYLFHNYRVVEEGRLDKLSPARRAEVDRILQAGPLQLRHVAWTNDSFWKSINAMTAKRWTTGDNLRQEVLLRRFVKNARVRKTEERKAQEAFAELEHRKKLESY